MRRVSHRLPEAMIEELERQVETGEYPNRSEAFREAVRNELGLDDHDQPSRRQGRGAASLEQPPLKRAYFRLPEPQMVDLDRYAEAKGHATRSEAIRTAVRNELERWRGSLVGDHRDRPNGVWRRARTDGSGGPR